MRYIDAVKTVSYHFKKARVIHALAGGLAFSIHSGPRTTLDIDIIVQRDTPEELIEECFRKVFRDFYRSGETLKYGLLDSSRYVGIDEDGVELVVDILKLSNSDYEKKLFRRTFMVPLHGRKINFIGREDLVVMKSVSSRKQDKLDAEMLLHNYGRRLNYKYINIWLRHAGCKPIPVPEPPDKEPAAAEAAEREAGDETWMAAEAKGTGLKTDQDDEDRPRLTVRADMDESDGIGEGN